MVRVRYMHGAGRLEQRTDNLAGVKMTFLVRFRLRNRDDALAAV